MIKQKNKSIRNKPSALDFQFSGLFATDYRLITLLLMILPLIIYAQVYDFEFVWDDISEPIGHLGNPFFDSPSGTSFTQLFTQPFFGMYIPITYLLWGGLKSFAEFFSLPLNSALHLSNVVVHIINGLLVFTLLKQFVVNKWAVLIGTLFFLLHPIQVEVVAWVSEFRTLLAFCFSLSALYIYLKNEKKFSLLSLFLYALALLSKPSAVVLPLIIFTINYFHYELKLKNNTVSVLPFAVLALIATVITTNIQSSTVATDYVINNMQRPIVWLDGIVFYLYQLTYPISLNPFYGFDAKSITEYWWFYLLAWLPLALGTLLWLERKKQPLLFFAVVLFVIGFLPNSGFIDFTFQQHSLVADRYMYFSMIGIAMAIASVADRKYWRWVLVSILLVFVFFTIKQIPIWQNPATLWTRGVEYDSYYAKKELGTSANRKANALIAEGELDSALKYVGIAFNAYPKAEYYSVGEVYYTKGLIYIEQKQFKQAELAFSQAISTGTKDLQKVKDEHQHYFQILGIAKAQQGKLQPAIDDFIKALEINPDNTKARNGKIYAHLLLKQCKQAQQEANFILKNKLQMLPSLQTALQQQCPKQ